MFRTNVDFRANLENSPETPLQKAEYVSLFPDYSRRGDLSSEMGGRIHPIRKTTTRRNYIHLPDVAIYTGAATSSSILADVVTEPSVFFSESMSPATFSERVGPDWFGIFPDTTSIFGHELMAVIATIFNLRDFLMGP